MGDKDTIRAVLDFARKLRDETPERLRLRMTTGDAAIVTNAHSRLLERERVAADLLRLLEDSGINIHEEG